MLRGVSQQHVRAFGFSSPSAPPSATPPMANIPMPYIEESSVSQALLHAPLLVSNGTRLLGERLVRFGRLSRPARDANGLQGTSFPSSYR